MVGALFNDVINAIHTRPWVSQLAGILPLSALIDFLDVPRILHVFELTGRMPLWCWTITPSGSRLLLAERGARDICCLDRFENGHKPLCLDGRFGDMYPMASGQTLNMCLRGTKCRDIVNTHPNIAAEADKRPQLLEIVSVKRIKSLPSIFEDVQSCGKTQGSASCGTPQQGSTAPTRLCRLGAILPAWSASHQPSYGGKYVMATIFGWAVWSLLIIFTVLTNCWITLAFLSVVVLAGITVVSIFGCQPRKPGERGSSAYNRLVLAAYHMNDTNWKVFFGESAVVNSLLNWPLLRRKHREPHWALVLALRALIFCQWALAVGAAAKQGWDAYLITFWIMFCIPMQMSVFSSEDCVRNWLESSTKVCLERSRITVSSRRALINAVIALNPDTFPEHVEMEAQGVERLDYAAMLWVDAILKPGPGRAQWQEASYE